MIEKERCFDTLLKESIDDGEYSVKIEDIKKLDSNITRFCWKFTFIDGKYKNKTLLHYSNFVTEENKIYFKRDLLKAGCNEFSSDSGMMHEIEGIIGNYIKIFKKTKQNNQIAIYITAQTQPQNDYVPINKKPRQIFFNTTVRTRSGINR